MKKIIFLICIMMLLSAMNTLAYAAKKDVASPVITKTDPQNNATDIMVERTIVIRFSEAVKKGKSISKISITDMNKSNVNFSYTIANNRLLITPKTDLKSNMKYTITIPAAAVCDAFGNNLQSKYIFCFVTEESNSDDKDNFEWKDSDFANLPKPEAILTAIVKDENTGSVMSTFSKMSTDNASAYVNSLKDLGYSGDCDYNDEDGTIYTAEDGNGFAVAFTYSSITQEGTILYRHRAPDNEDSISDEISGEDTDITDAEDTEEVSDTSTNIVWQPKIALSNIYTRISLDSEEILVVTISDGGTIRIEEGETPKIIYHIDTNNYTIEADYELRYTNNNPMYIKTSYLSHTDNTVSFLIEPLRVGSGDFSFELANPDRGGIASIGSCHFVIYH